ncbi:recombinase, partial [Methylobacterium frigidaeris]
ARESCSKRHVTMMISLAFLSPELVKAAVGGRLSRGIGLRNLSDPSMAWSRQHRSLGL